MPRELINLVIEHVVAANPSDAEIIKEHAREVLEFKDYISTQDIYRLHLPAEVMKKCTEVNPRALNPDGSYAVSIGFIKRDDGKFSPKIVG